MNENQTIMLEKILSWITNDKLRNAVKEEMHLLPEYFWNVAASSSGKYHPSYCLGEGGLFRHVAATCVIAHEMFGANGTLMFTDTEKDVVIASLLLHDGYKHGIEDSGHTVHEHPKLMSEYIRNKYYKEDADCNYKETVMAIVGCIESHMGQWTTSPYSDVILLKPLWKLERFVHYCDYLASRKCIEVNLEEVFHE